ncbi:hypothetical protein SOVF_018710 [Spinacia oleracea]|uniref:Uncharacterized protein n=1 Tax=Spinacia oleracea TaxID=3562 RepID=A0A9R0IZ42_SPIOL|nr:uncharacterized protein LOC110796807 [Spinacia oleracea]KNA24133.1 hypothetical protein SOVF_018710 [Spinacia oleracea]
MEDFTGFKLKRKDLEDVNDDFSDFSLSSPARKIRRLDAELPPIIEEEEVDYQPMYEQSVPQSTISNGLGVQVKPLVIEELESIPENEEKAIVLFKPKDDPLVSSQGNFSVDPNLVSFFKNQAFWGDNLKSCRSIEEDESTENGNDNEENECRAVIPWVPSQTVNPVSQGLGSQTDSSDSMEADEMETTMMEIEDGANVGQANGVYNLSYLNGGLQHQWHQQQHCMMPQPPQNTTTPIVWYR